MNKDLFNQQQENSSSGYAPNIQVTTGTYSVAVSVSQSSESVCYEFSMPINAKDSQLNNPTKQVEVGIL